MNIISIAVLAGFLLFFVLLLIAIIFGTYIPAYQTYKNATGNIVNHDPTMQKFVYKVFLSKQQILDILSHTENTDLLYCHVDLEQSIIEFSDLTYKDKFNFEILELNNFSVLRLNRILFQTSRGSLIVYKLNPFLVQKLNAEIIPYAL